MSTGPSRSLCSDSRRALVATAVACVVPVVLGLLNAWLGVSNGRWSTPIVLVLIGWNLFALVYVLLSVRAFSGVDQSEFVSRMAARASQRPAAWRRLNPHGDGPTYAIEATVVSFVVVLVLPKVPGIRIHDWVLIPLTLSILLSCWALSIVAYALHYAQNDIAEPSLDFPGSRTGAFADYLYFSIAVATTFGATDVSITTPKMRKVVNLHTIVTFLYNSVIVALLASLLIR